MLKSEKITLSKYEVSVIGMLVISLLPTFGVLVLQIVRDIILDEMNNYRIYFVTGVVFVTMLILSAYISVKFAREIQIPALVLKGSVGVILVSIILLLAKCYLNSATVYPCLSGEWFPWHSKSNLKMFVFMTGISVIGILVSLWAGKQRKLIEVVRYPAYLLASGLAGFSMYCGNFFASDKMHGSAYYTSIYNALMGEPYTYSNRSIYGHYAILLKYPVKLFGGDYEAFNIVIAVVGGLSLFFVALALDKCVTNHFISIIAIWAIPMMFWYYPLNHWQMFPHRVFFAGIELFLIVSFFYNGKKWKKVLGYLVSCLSLVWNVETGIVCLGVWAVTCIVYDVFYIQEKWNWKFLAYNIIKNIADSFLTIIGMIGIFNFYNMSLGEAWHGLRFILYPHLSSWDMPEIIEVQASETVMAVENVVKSESLQSWKGGFASGLSIHFPLQISYWYFVFLLMGLTIVFCVVRVLYKCAEKNDYIIGLTAALALGHLVYFVNRPCFDYLAICFFEAALIMAVVADRAIDRKSEIGYGKRSIQFIVISVLSVLSVLSIWQICFRVSGRIEDGFYNHTQLDEITMEIAEVVPKDTYALGMGIQEIYAELGWDTKSHVTDFLAIDCTGGDGLSTLIMETAEQQECVVCFRSKKSENRQTIEQYMKNWGYEDAAIKVKAFWNLDIDKDWYWNIYYLELDQSIKNNLVEHHGALIK